MSESRIVKFQAKSFLITEIGEAEVECESESRNGNVLRETNLYPEHYSRKGFEAQFRLHKKRVIEGRQKEEIDTERVRKRKQTKIFRCAMAKKRKEQYATIEDVAQARREHKLRNVFDNQLPAEVTACDKRRRCFYWG